MYQSGKNVCDDGLHTWFNHGLQSGFPWNQIRMISVSLDLQRWMGIFLLSLLLQNPVTDKHLANCKNNLEQKNGVWTVRFDFEVVK